MPRPRQFDPDDALDSATELFWRCGYAGTGYDDLVAVTGASRKGLYSAFGDKESLFAKALSRYRCGVVPNILAGLDQPDVTVGNVAEVIRCVGGLAASPAGRRGCLMANTAVDAACDLPPVRAEVGTHLREMSAAFATALQRAGVEPYRSRELGDYCCGVLQGLFVMARARTPGTMIERFAEQAARSLA